LAGTIHGGVRVAILRSDTFRERGGGGGRVDPEAKKGVGRNKITAIGPSRS